MKLLPKQPLAKELNTSAVANLLHEHDAYWTTGLVEGILYGINLGTPHNAAMAKRNLEKLEAAIADLKERLVD